MGFITGNIIPEVISVTKDGGQLLSHTHTVLTSKVVRLTISPVEPLDSFILMGPDPLSRVSLAVPLSSIGSHPELRPVSSLCPVEPLDSFILMGPDPLSRVSL